MSRRFPVLATLVTGLLLLSACTGDTMQAPASAPPPDAKPVLASPPASLITPHGY